MKNMNEMKAERVKISKNYRERANEELFSIINTLHNGKDVIREKWTIVDEKVNGKSSNFVDAFRNRLGKNETCQIAPVTAELYFSKWVNNNFELSSSADYILKTVGTTWYHMRCLVHFHHHQQQSVTLYFAYNKYVSMERVCVCVCLWELHYDDHIQWDVEQHTTPTKNLKFNSKSISKCGTLMLFISRFRSAFTVTHSPFSNQRSVFAALFVEINFFPFLYFLSVVFYAFYHKSIRSKPIEWVEEERKKPISL